MTLSYEFCKLVPSLINVLFPGPISVPLAIYFCPWPAPFTSADVPNFLVPFNMPLISTPIPHRHLLLGSFSLPTCLALAFRVPGQLWEPCRFPAPLPARGLLHQPVPLLALLHSWLTY